MDWETLPVVVFDECVSLLHPDSADEWVRLKHWLHLPVLDLPEKATFHNVVSIDDQLIPFCDVAFSLKTRS